MMEKTLVLLKPDALQRGLVGEILHRFERCGLKMVAMKMAYADEATAGQHYIDDEEWLQNVGEKVLKGAEKKGSPLNMEPKEAGEMIRQQLIAFMSSSPIVAIVLEGHNAIAHVRKVVGATAPEHAVPGTIRGDYAFETYQMADELGRPIKNLIHASDSVETANREIDVWFTPKEMHVWQRVDEVVFYAKGK